MPFYTGTKHEIDFGAAVCPTEDLGDLFPLEELAKACINVTIQLAIETS